MRRVVLLTLFFLLFDGGVYPADLQPAFKGREKIDAQLVSEWRDAMESGDLQREVLCIVKTARRARGRVIRRIRKAGFIPEAVLHTVVAGRIKVGDIPSLARLDDVVYVEHGKKLGLK